MISQEMAEKCTIIRILAGSHVHGLAVETSDHDEEAIIIEPLDQAMGLEKPFEEKIVEKQLEACEDFHISDLHRVEDCRACKTKDIKWVSLRKWCHLALKGNPNFLLPLFAPLSHVLKMDARGSQLRAMTNCFISKQTVKSHLGYMQGQRNRLTNHQREFGAGGGRGTPRFDLIDKFGYDTKFGMHLIRLGMQGCELLETGKLVLPIDEDRRGLLMCVRRGEVDLPWVLKMADDLEAKMKDGVGNSSLPDKPDYAAVETFMLRMYIRAWSAAQCHQDILDDARILASFVGGSYD